MFSFVLAVVILGTASCQLVPKPSFAWRGDVGDPIPILSIAFPNGDVDRVNLKTFNPIPVGDFELEEDVDECIYHGYLENEPEVYVTLTGCAHSDNFDIQFRSQRLADNMFQVTNGQVEIVKPIFKTGLASNRSPLVRDRIVKFVENQENSGITNRALNPNGYILKVKVYYDANFKKKFGTNSTNVIRRVFAHAQNLWLMKSSLKTTVTFDIDRNIDPVAGRYVAENDIDKVAALPKNKTFNSNVYMAFRNNKPGTVGIAYFQSTCSSPKGRTALCEYFVNDMNSGETVAHEIGHNLGMDHDFNDDPSVPRVDSKGQACSGIGGIMDYYGTSDKWSTCSVEDFEAYVNMFTTFCLKVNSLAG